MRALHKLNPAIMQNISALGFSENQMAYIRGDTNQLPVIINNQDDPRIHNALQILNTALMIGSVSLFLEPTSGAVSAISAVADSQALLSITQNLSAIQDGLEGTIELARSTVRRIRNRHTPDTNQPEPEPTNSDNSELAQSYEQILTFAVLSIWIMDPTVSHEPSVLLTQAQQYAKQLIANSESQLKEKVSNRGLLGKFINSVYKDNPSKASSALAFLTRSTISEPVDIKKWESHGQNFAKNFFENQLNKDKRKTSLASETEQIFSAFHENLDTPSFRLDCLLFDALKPEYLEALYPDVYSETDSDPEVAEIDALQKEYLKIKIVDAIKLNIHKNFKHNIEIPAEYVELSNLVKENAFFNEIAEHVSRILSPSPTELSRTKQNVMNMITAYIIDSNEYKQNGLKDLDLVDCFLKNSLQEKVLNFDFNVMFGSHRFKPSSITTSLPSVGSRFNQALSDNLGPEASRS
jgi:hypothetical protein